MRTEKAMRDANSKNQGAAKNEDNNESDTNNETPDKNKANDVDGVKNDTNNDAGGGLIIESDNGNASMPMDIGTTTASTKEIENAISVDETSYSGELFPTCQWQLHATCCALGACHVASQGRRRYL
jgi:hypothetical protein